MSKIFNFDSPGNDGGWSNKNDYFKKEEIEGDKFKSGIKPGENPRVAVPSPFARFQIVQEAFGNVDETGGRIAADRDKMLVSQVLDIMELGFEGGISSRNNLKIDAINLDEVTAALKNISSDSDNLSGAELLGSTLEDYIRREPYGFYENSTLYVIHRNENPLAITSPTSGWLPTPNYKEWADSKDLLINDGSLPIFSKTRDLVSRKEEFILSVYEWYDELLRQNNGKEPAPIENFGRYLTQQEKRASEALKARIQEIRNRPVDKESKYDGIRYSSVYPEVWGVKFYSLKRDIAGSLIEQQSDLRLAPTVENAPHPLVLSNNNVQSNLIYTSGQTKWKASESNLSYADEALKLTPICDRILPNGQYYKDGFIYEHDFLADSLMQLPYKFNSDKFFDGNVQGFESDSIGLIPPVTERYFDFFTVADLKKNMRMVVCPNPLDPSNPDSVEVTLDVPTTKGKTITLKKTYVRANSFVQAMEKLNSSNEDNSSSSANAVGVLVPGCDVALNCLPFVKAFAGKSNYYAFQLLMDHVNLNDYQVRLATCTFERADNGSHEDKKGLCQYVRRKENGKPVIISYVLDGNNFDFLKWNFLNEREELMASALLIPRDGIGTYVHKGGTSLEFCFDFGTSNTFVAVKNNEGRFLDFRLPPDLSANQDWMVSTISPKMSDRQDLSIMSFIGYCRQEFLPKFGKSRIPFPVPTAVIAPYYKDPDMVIEPVKRDEQIRNPFFASSIPFIYGEEDYGRKYNEIRDDLKEDKDKSNSEFTGAFINELVFLAQVFAMSEGANLEKSKIYWTYPISMPKTKLNYLQNLWDAAYQKYFQGHYADNENDADGIAERDNNVFSFPESVAPMLYSHRGKRVGEDTIITVDIGGGTCDFVIVPNGSISKNLKISSIGFGANCIFGLGRAAKEIPMFSDAVKYICKQIEKKAELSKSGQLKQTLNDKKKDLENLLDEESTAQKMSTYLFNLSNNPYFADPDMSFNVWLQKRPYYHTVFLYYYAALIYYMSALWMDCPVDTCKPSTIYFSGSGSKLLKIVCGGNISLLEEYTTDLFNLFAREKIDKDELKETISLKMEEREPKQITAKGVLATVVGKPLNQLKEEMKEWKSPKDAKKYLSTCKMLNLDKGSYLTYEKLTEDSTIDELESKINDFHARLLKFLEKHEEEMKEIIPDMTARFIDKRTPKKLRNTIQGVVDAAVEDSTGDPEDEYPDVPFMQVIKRFISVDLEG